MAAVMTVQEAAVFAGVSEDEINQHIRGGNLHPIAVGPDLYVRRAELQAILGSKVDRPGLLTNFVTRGLARIHKTRT